MYVHVCIHVFIDIDMLDIGMLDSCMKELLQLGVHREHINKRSHRINV